MADPTKPFNQILSDALTHFLTNWKTSVAGALTLAVVTAAYLLTVPTIPHSLTVPLTIIAGLGKIYISVIQSDGQGPAATN